MSTYKPQLKYFKLWFALWLGYLAFLSYICLTPIEVANLPEIPFLDKIVHIGAYIVLAYTFAELNRSNKLIVIFCFFYGLAIELIQPYTGRFFEWADLLANSTGLIIGLCVQRKIIQILPRIDHFISPK